MLEEEHEGIAHPKHCFCQIPKEELMKWAAKRFREGKSTIDLLKETTDPKEKEAISAVALLDVDEKTLLEMMADVSLPEHHILHCRTDVKKILKQL